MFEQEYNNLYESEKQEFRRIANYLLSKTFVVRDVYDKVLDKVYERYGNRNKSFLVNFTYSISEITFTLRTSIT